MKTLSQSMATIDELSAILWTVSPSLLIPYLVNGYPECRKMPLAEAKKFIARSLITGLLSELEGGKELYKCFCGFDNSVRHYSGGELTPEAYRDILAAVAQMDTLLGYPMMDLEDLVSLTLGEYTPNEIGSFIESLNDASVQILLDRIEEKHPIRPLLRNVYKRILQGKGLSKEEYRDQLEALTSQ